MNQMKTLNEHWLVGEILAYQGKYKEAASYFIKNNLSEKAINLYTTLKKFTEANELIKKHGNKSDPVILMKQAEYLRDTGQWKEAAELFCQAQKYKDAIEIYGKRGVLDSVMEVCKNLDKAKNKAEIELCAKYFRQAGHHTFAK
jgi:intraflagellar transport protein 122